MARADLAGAAHLELVSGVVQLRPEDAGWRRCCAAGGRSRRRAGCARTPSRRGSSWCAGSSGSPTSTRGAGCPAHVDEWSLSLMTESHLAPSTIRGYQTDLRLFSEFLSDARYGWVLCARSSSGRGCTRCRSATSGTRSPTSTTMRAIRKRGRSPVRSCSGSSTTPTIRSSALCGRNARARWPLTGTRRFSRWCMRGGCGAPRRRSWISLTGAVIPAAPEFGRFGMLHVRYGKAMRGQPPRRRNVPSVMGWAVEAVADYVDNIRPRFGCEEHPALWVTERGGRVEPAEINARFVAYRDAFRLPKSLAPHSLRHSWVTHLTEDGVDRRFIQSGVGHDATARRPSTPTCQRRLHEHRSAQGASAQRSTTPVRRRKEC